MKNMESQNISEAQAYILSSIKEELLKKGVSINALELEDDMNQPSILVSFASLTIRIYQDGSTEFSSQNRISKLFGIFPSKIDWRIEISQYLEIEKVKMETVASIDEALKLISAKSKL